jgi:hypothetical protein
METLGIDPIFAGWVVAALLIAWWQNRKRE